ncbi:hypothetical protein ACFPMF_14075 [Larkinella bovis]|uniref:T9SS type A sorting domain-containing protein n=1 Tax=Larkinella bovis TaxID=683041 RepID=A0ABW0IC19_9BACT
MKTIVRTTRALLVGAFLLLGTSSFAQVKLDTKAFLVATFPSADPLKLWMNIQKNDAKSKLIVRLIDGNNRVLFAETLPKHTDTYRQRFDLSQMADGAYTLQVTNGSETVEKAFQVKTSGIQERTTQRLLTVVPVIEPQTGM